MPASRVKHELALIMKEKRDTFVTVVSTWVDTQKVLKVTMSMVTTDRGVITGLKENKQTRS